MHTRSATEGWQELVVFLLTGDTTSHPGRVLHPDIVITGHEQLCTRQVFQGKYRHPKLLGVSSDIATTDKHVWLHIAQDGYHLLPHLAICGMRIRMKIRRKCK
jgi:hypothetical protein